MISTQSCKIIFFTECKIQQSKTSFLPPTIDKLFVFCPSFSPNLIHVTSYPPKKSLSWWSESLRPPSWEKQFWEFHVTSSGLFGACSRSDLQNMWMKGMHFKPPPPPSPPQFLFRRGPGGREWGLADEKQGIWPINLSLLWLRELSVCFKEKGGWRERQDGLVGEVHDQQQMYLADNKQLGAKGLKLQNSLKAKEEVFMFLMWPVTAQYGWM